MQPGLESHAFNRVFTAFGTGLNTIGPYVARLHIKLHIAMRTNHPEFGAPAHRWLRDEGRHQENFERQKDPTSDWLESPLDYPLRKDADEMRRRPDDPQPADDFPFFDAWSAGGATG